MTNRYDDLSDRARWFLQNFDEIDLADLCAAHEASNQTRQDAIDRVKALCASRQTEAVDGGDTDADSIQPSEVLAALDETAPSHDTGPSVAECAKADRAWDLQKGGE